MPTSTVCGSCFCDAQWSSGPPGGNDPVAFREHDSLFTDFVQNDLSVPHGSKSGSTAVSGAKIEAEPSTTDMPFEGLIFGKTIESGMTGIKPGTQSIQTVKDTSLLPQETYITSDTSSFGGVPTPGTTKATSTKRTIFGSPMHSAGLRTYRDQRSVACVDPELTIETVVDEERCAIARRNQRLIDAQIRLGKPFSVAFSGGGIRAAAYQSGVLRRLAEKGLLKDVDYFAAVSGGAYISSSFASHLYGMPQPEQSPQHDATKQANSHILEVVAKTICRMQENAGNFVRDPAIAGKSVGSGRLPPVFDLPLLIGTLLVTIIINPVQIMVVYLAPVTEIIELFYGSALRAGFCAPDDWIHILVYDSPFLYLLYCLAVAVPTNLVMWILGKTHVAGTAKGKATTTYLLLHGAKHCLMRFTLTVASLLALLFLVGYTENFAYPDAVRLAACQNYIRSESQSRSNCGDAYQQHIADNEKERWYDRQCYQFLLDFNYTLTCTNGKCTRVEYMRVWQREHCCYRESCTNEIKSPKEVDLEFHAQRRLSDEGFDSRTGGSSVPGPYSVLELLVPATVSSVFSFCFSVLGSAIVISFALAPFFPALFVGILTTSVPFMYLIAMVVFVQYRIFGGLIGGQQLVSSTGFSHENWKIWTTMCVLANLALVPFYNESQRIWHKYYSQCLKKSFFYNGEDIPMRCLVDEHNDEGSVPCPFMLVTGTVSDYKPDYSSKAITEISFSPLHAGSSRTGYIRQLDFRSLAKATALTGAGCLDAISLSMSHRLRFRILLQVLNLSWGDFVLFNEHTNSKMERLANVFPLWMRGAVLMHLHEAPFSIVWVIFVLAGWIAIRTAQGSGSDDCLIGRRLVACVVIGGVLLFAASFFTFIGPLQHLLYSPIIRQFHQFSRFQIRGYRAPGMLYCTDGGVQDCTAILQLVERRCGRILLVLAAADPQDQLAVFKTAMQAVTTRKLGSFFDLADPRRNIDILMEEFAADKSRTTFRLGIKYGWSDEFSIDDSEAALGVPDGPSVGRLTVVKNRLPADSELDKVPCQPLLTEDEICGRSKPDSSAHGVEHPAWQRLKATDLGGLGCCDCCHSKCGCHCGGKFPHLTGANYLWLTPRLFSSLSRLGYEMSREAADELLAESFEASLAEDAEDGPVTVDSEETHSFKLKSI